MLYVGADPLPCVNRQAISAAVHRERIHRDGGACCSSQPVPPLGPPTRLFLHRFSLPGPPRGRVRRGRLCSRAQ